MANHDYNQDMYVNIYLSGDILAS